MKKLLVIGLALGSFQAFAGGGGSCAQSNLTAWTSTNNALDKLQVTAGSAMAGTDCGLSVEVVNQNGGQASRHFVQDSSPDLETRYRAAVCIDPNSLPLPSSGPNRRVKFLQVQCAGGNCESGDVMQFKLQNDGTGYQLDLWVRDKNISTYRNRHFIDIADGPTRVEFDLNLAASSLKVWVNPTAESDTPAVDLTGLDIAAWPVVTRARLGSMDKSSNAGIGSTYYLDEFESRRQTFIGGTCANP